MYSVYSSVMVGRSIDRHSAIQDTQIAGHVPCKSKFRRFLSNAYQKAKLYESVMALVEANLLSENNNLATFNINLNQSILDYLGCTTAIHRSSTIPARPQQDKVGCIAENGITTVFQENEHRVYPQLWGD